MSPTDRGPSLAWRAIEAIALLLGFYLLVGTIALLMIASPLLEWVLVDRLHYVILGVAFGGLVLLWSLVPRRERWVDPGVPFDATTQPELWAAVERIAVRSGQPVPAFGYLLHEVDAFVTKRGSVLGLGGRPASAIGVPLMAILDEAELESVLAHEFGHFSGGDTKLGPVVYATRKAIGRSLNATDREWLQWLFTVYGNFYLRRTRSVSRAQECAADRLAARLTTPEATAVALFRLQIGAAAFEFFLAEEYVPVIERGRRPPYLEGLRQALGSSLAREHATSDVALGRDRQSEFDSHPPTVERIRALGIDPAVVEREPRCDGASLRMLRDLPDVEAAIVRRQLSVDPATLTTIAWEEVAVELMAPSWRAGIARLLAPTAPDLRPADLPTDDNGLAELGGSIARANHHSAHHEDQMETGRALGARLLMAAAVDAGWTPVTGIGERVEFRRAETTFDPVSDWDLVLRGELDAATWRARLEAAGLRASAREISGD